MKPILTMLGGLLLMLAGVADAQAVVCARGAWRAGCVGPNGAVVARRPVAAPRRSVVVVPAHRCRWVNGVRVCR
jgi:hypothetical protein